MKWKNVLTLGVGWLIERAIAKRIPRTLDELLGEVARGNADKVPPELAPALDVLKAAAVQAQMAAAVLEFERVARELQATFAKFGPEGPAKLPPPPTPRPR